MIFNEKSIRFLKNKGYIRKGQTIEDRVDEIVKVVKSYEGMYKREGLSERVRELILTQKLSLSTPQLANLGVPQVEGSTPSLPCSCNIVTYPDSISGIYYSHGESAYQRSGPNSI